MDFLTGALLAAQVGTGLIQSFGQAKQGNQAAAAANQNAQIYDQYAQQITAEAAFNKEVSTRQKRSFISTQKTNYAFRGVKMTGSPLLVMADSAAELETDIQIAEYNALTRAAYSKSMADSKRMEARNYRMAGMTSAGITLLNTAAKASNFIPKSGGSGTVNGVRSDGSTIKVSYP